jgi:ABC-type uncharacterized transport system fused permease/ATPase subunit
MTIGTLRDQIIYPDSHGDMRRKGIKDENLNDLLDKVQLTYLIQREGGFDGVQDWMDVLSGGEKQRIAVRIHFIIVFCNRCFTYGMISVLVHSAQSA